MPDKFILSVLPIHHARPKGVIATERLVWQVFSFVVRILPFFLPPSFFFFLFFSGPTLCQTRLKKEKEEKIEEREKKRDFRAYMKCRSNGRGEKTSVTFIYFLERKVSQMLPAVDFIRHEVFSFLYFIFSYPSTVNLSTLIRPISLSLSLSLFPNVN